MKVITKIDGKELPVWERAEALFKATWDTPAKKELRENHEKLVALKTRLSEVKVEKRQKLRYNEAKKAWEFA